MAALDKAMRSDLNAWSDFWFWVLVVSTIFVAIGIICEAPEAWQTVGWVQKGVERARKLWYIRLRRIDLDGWAQLCPELITKKDHNRKRIATIGFIGWMFVAVGVLGEGVSEYFVSDAETDIRAFDEGALIDAQHQAGDAATSAKIAHDEADAVKQEAKGIEKHLAIASTELEELEGDILAQGPRPNILRVRREEFVKALKPFAPQKVTVELCGSPAPETYETFRSLRFNIFGDETPTGPGWHAKGAVWFSCPPNGLGPIPLGFGGNLVITSSAASDGVKKAADALRDALNEIGIIANRNEIRANDVGPNTFKSPEFFGPDSPWELAYKDPTSVVLFIGPIAPNATAGQKQRHK